MGVCARRWYAIIRITSVKNHRQTSIAKAHKRVFGQWGCGLWLRLLPFLGPVAQSDMRRALLLGCKKSRPLRILANKDVS